MADTIDPEMGVEAGIILEPLLSPEQRLWAAVLIEAIDCVSGIVVGASSRDTAKRGYEEALEWVNSQKTEPLSFAWVCCQCGVDPDYLGAKIRLCRLQWRHTRLSVGRRFGKARRQRERQKEEEYAEEI
jgi:hypothetical protein